MKSILSGIFYNGIVITDQHLEPLYVSETARPILSLLFRHDDCWEEGRLAISPLLHRQQLEQCKNMVSKVKHPESEDRQFDLLAEVGTRRISASLRLVDLFQGQSFFVVVLDSPAPSPCVAHCLKKTELSRREVDVALPACKGLSNAQIAQKLSISGYTVANHLRSIYNKMHVGNRTSLAHHVTSLLLRETNATGRLPFAAVTGNASSRGTRRTAGKMSGGKTQGLLRKRPDTPRCELSLLAGRPGYAWRS